MQLDSILEFSGVTQGLSPTRTGCHTVSLEALWLLL